MKSCPHCNRPFPPELDIRGPIRKKLWDFVRAHPQGVTRQQIEDAIYADDVDGGPLSATRVVYTLVHKINKTLQPYGMRIRGEPGRGSRYWLEEIRQLPRSAGGTASP